MLLNVEIKKYLANANIYQKNLFNEYRNKNRFKSEEFLKMDNEEEIYKIEQDIIAKKKKEESEKNNNSKFENKAKSSTKIKNLISGIQISLNDNRKMIPKIFGTNKPKKNLRVEIFTNANYGSNINNNDNTNNNINRASTRKSSMNYLRKNNFTKEFNSGKNNIYKFHKKINSKEKSTKDEYEYHNTLRSPFRANKNNKIQ